MTAASQSSAVERHVIERIAAAPVRTLPYPHFYLKGIFPHDFYPELLANLPGDDGFTCLGDTGRVTGDGFNERFVFTLSDAEIEALPAAKRGFWHEVQSWLLGEALFRALIAKFAAAAAKRFADKLDRVQLTCEALVVRDRTNYSIGPHTDALHRFLSLLFYCPRDARSEHLGTSLYMPIDRAFTCIGGPHYGFEKFVRLETMPYRPNSLFGFLKTDKSFHGVEPIAEPDVARDLILYDIRVANPSVLADELEAAQE